MTHSEQQTLELENDTAELLCLASGSPPISFSRKWAMPNGDTFSIPVIGEWVQRRLRASKVSVDPFARNKRWATHTNDLNPETAAEHHMEARAFLEMLVKAGVRVDLVLFDPPYSPRQISECYASAGLTTTMKTTQASFWGDCKRLITQLAAPECVCLSFGWNSGGMGKPWRIEEIMLVPHGGWHNDTICTADRLPANSKR